jgi:alpha-galactosidase
MSEALRATGRDIVFSLSNRADFDKADEPIDLYVKELDDGSKAVGFFNRSAKDDSGRFSKLAAIGVNGKEQARDLWRQKDLPPANGFIDLAVPADGVLLVKLTPLR